MSYFDPKLQDEITIAQVSLTNIGTPWAFPDSILDAAFVKYAPEVFALQPNPAAVGGRVGRPWGELMAYARMDLSLYNGNGINLTDKRINLRFVSIADLRTYLQAWVPHAWDPGSGQEVFTGDCIARIYFPVDRNINTVDHIVAYNKFYSVLNGGAHLVKANSLSDIYNNVSDILGRNSVLVPAFIRQAWKILWNVDIDAVDPAWVWTGKEDTWMGTIWTQRHKRKLLHRLPSTGVGMDVRNDQNVFNYRWYFSPADNRPYKVTAGEHFEIEKMYVCMIPIVDKVASPVGWGNGLIWFGGHAKHQAADYWLFGGGDPTRNSIGLAGRSCLAVYGIRRGPWQAIYIKPYAGVDSFHFPKWSNNDMDLMAMTSRPMHRDKIFRIDSYYSSTHQFTPFFLPKDRLIMTVGSVGYQKMVAEDFSNVKFCVLDRKTGMVSALGGAEIIIEKLRDRYVSPITISVRSHHH
jgi:hypothetical protein